MLATAFVDRTRRLAGDLGIDHQALLGHTIAHKLGHCCWRPRHTRKVRLMREAWSRQELMGTRGVDWLFAPRDVATIRAWRAPLTAG